MTNFNNCTFFLFNFALAFALLPSGVFAQDVVSEFSNHQESEQAYYASNEVSSEVDEGRSFDLFPASPISFGLSVGARAGFTSLDGEYSNEDYESFIHNIGIGAAINLDLNLGRWSRTELMLGYRGSMSHTLAALWSNPGTEHHHDLSFSVGLLDTIRISVGGGLAVMHNANETALGGGVHLDFRKHLPKGLFVAVPFDLAFYPIGGSGELVATFTIGIQFGWNSRQ